MKWENDPSQSGPNWFAETKRHLEFAKDAAQVTQAVGKCPLDENVDAADCAAAESCWVPFEKRRPGVCEQCDYLSGF